MFCKHCITPGSIGQPIGLKCRAELIICHQSIINAQWDCAAGGAQLMKRQIVNNRLPAVEEVKAFGSNQMGKVVNKLTKGKRGEVFNRKINREPM